MFCFCFIILKCLSIVYLLFNPSVYLIRFSAYRPSKTLKSLPFCVDFISFSRIIFTSLGDLKFILWQYMPDFHLVQSYVKF